MMMCRLSQRLVGHSGLCQFDLRWARATPWCDKAKVAFILCFWYRAFMEPRKFGKKGIAARL